jgi:hypothetical protein
MVRLVQQQLSSAAAHANAWMPLTHLLRLVRQLLSCWCETVSRGPALLPLVVRALLPLVQQCRAAARYWCGQQQGQQQHTVHQPLVFKLAAAATAVSTSCSVC